MSYLLEQITTGWASVFPQERSLQRAMALAFGILCGVGKRTVTRAISFHGNTQKDWSADYKVFSRSGWNPRALFNPNPVRVGGVDTGEYAGGVTVAGNYAYVANSGGLKVIDVSNAANPVRVGGYDTSGFVEGVAVAGDLIYVADRKWGLLILELSRLPWLEVSRLNPLTFRLSGGPGTNVRLQRSSNLQDWEDWQTVTLGDAPMELSDPDAAPTGARFFRAIQP